MALITISPALDAFCPNQLNKKLGLKMIRLSPLLQHNSYQRVQSAGVGCIDLFFMDIICADGMDKRSRIDK
ncbi:MAG TPA: hypothetical protein VMJ33_07145 [Gallionella sp.]|nr:hypothetical protein [Gallionella sp.]